MLKATAEKIIKLIGKLKIKENGKKIFGELKRFAVKTYKKAVPAIKEYSLMLYGKIKKQLLKLIKAGASASEKLSDKAINKISYGILAVMLLLVLPAGNMDFGYKIVCDGEVAGVVSKKSEAVQIVDDAQSELETIETSIPAKEIKIVFTVSNKDMIQQGSLVTNSVIACYDGRVDCYGIYADGTLAAVLSNESDAKTLLEEYKNEFRTEETESLSFSKFVEIKPVRMVQDDILTKEDALLALKAPEIKTVTYKVKAGDTFSTIAYKNNLSVKALAKLNPGVDAEDIREDQILNLTDTTPFVAVRESRKVTESESVQYETNKIEDSSSYEGTTVVVENGILGEKEVEYEVVYENGVMVGKNALNETVTKDPVSATVRVGTKPRPRTAPTGSFIIPYASGRLTSRYGSYRSRGTPHTGIDLAGPTGSNIIAADGGTVTFAGWNNSYGYYIKIRHADGFETYYAHCSKLLVSAGDQVYQGQVIGKVGNTGNSTGPHLHFELRKNGATVNPYNYFR